MDAERDGGEPNGYQGSSHLHPGASRISPPSRQRKLKVGVTTQSRPAAPRGVRFVNVLFTTYE